MDRFDESNILVYKGGGVTIRGSDRVKTTVLRRKFL